MRIGSLGFQDYNRTLRRIYLLEMIDRQMQRAKRKHVRLSLVAPPCEIVGGPDRKAAAENAKDVSGRCG